MNFSVRTTKHMTTFANNWCSLVKSMYDCELFNENKKYLCPPQWDKESEKKQKCMN